MAEPCKPVRLDDWIEENRGQFRKPVGNKLVWENGDFIAFVSGGNSRNDFHINPGDEIFVQIRGDVRVDLQVDGQRVINYLREGEALLVPAFVPHAPRRPEGTYGFVVERVRRPGELDSFAWHCESCNNELHRVCFQLEDIVKQFAGFLKEFDADEDARRCKQCGEVLAVHGDFTLDSQMVPGARTS
ncbi:MAG: 3-hydroxyanthranilate 3,4-dioxygenase [Solirubrobacteraceae bacterium]